MELINEKVKHKSLGIGTVNSFDGQYVEIQFAAKVSRFLYPEAFETFLILEDPDKQAAILAELASSKQAAEAKKREVEARRKAEEARNAALTSAKPAGSKSKKSIDEMFSDDYHAAHLVRQPILTYQQVEDQFGIQISGFGRGINPTSTKVVLISSIGKSGGKFVYHDKWTTDGDYLYSGEGKSGDQTMTKGNLAIINAARDGKEIHLFVKFSPQEYFYQGVFELKDIAYENDKDEEGNTRKEYKFRLCKVQ